MRARRTRNSFRGLRFKVQVYDKEKKKVVMDLDAADVHADIDYEYPCVEYPPFMERPVPKFFKAKLSMSLASYRK